MDNRKTWQGALIGAAGGALGALVMNGVSSLWQTLEKKQTPRGDKAGEQGEDATVKAARALAEPVLRRELTADEKKVGGPAVHYAFGAVTGALYGALAPTLPAVTLGMGTLYGTAVWALGDELAVPALGLSGSPTEQPASAHLKYLALHLAFGLTLEAVRRASLLVER